MDTFLIRAGNMWDGVSGSPSADTDILVRGGVIAGIGEGLEVPEGAEVIDLSGHTVMPGLIDCHVHLTLRPEFTAGFWRYSPSYKALLGVEALRTLLMNGFTTVRDCGDMDVHGYTVQDLKTALEKGMIAGPGLIVSGHMISARGGHMDFTRSISPENNAWENCLADGVDEIRMVVRREIMWGAEWVKYAASGGFSSAGDDPLQITYTQEEMDAVVETAHDFRRPVSVHVNGDEAVRRSVRAGVRSVEHGGMASKETFGLIGKEGVYVVPTQLASVRSARLADDDGYWSSLNMPGHVRRKIKKYSELIMDSAGHLARSDVRIAFGTDLGILPYHINGACEFAEMVANGITPLRALQAATSTAAGLLGMDGIGVLAPGKCADIVAVPGDPFADIRVMEKVDFVMKSGIVRKRGRLPEGAI